MSGKTILVLGGGVGGLVTASELRRQLSREHRILLIDRETKHIHNPSLPNRCPAAPYETAIMIHTYLQERVFLSWDRVQ